MSLAQLVEKVAKRYDVRVDSLPNGVLILVRDGVGFAQIAVVRNVYYVRYLNKDEAYVLYSLDEELVEKIINEKLDESENVLKIPDA